MKLYELLEKIGNYVEIEVVNKNGTTLFYGQKNFKNKKMKESLKKLKDNDVVNIFPIRTEKLLIEIETKKTKVKKYYIEITTSDKMDTISTSDNFDTETEAIEYFKKFTVSYPYHAYLVSCEYENGEYYPDSTQTERELTIR